MGYVHRFVARFDGHCAHCGGDIYEGDDIGYIDEEIACEDCCDEEDEA